MTAIDLEGAGPGGSDAPVNQPRKGDGLGRIAKARGAQAGKALKDGTRRSAQAAKAQAALASRKISDLTQDHPLTSVSGALALGLVAGLAVGLCAGRAMASGAGRE